MATQDLIEWGITVNGTQASTTIQNLSGQLTNTGNNANVVGDKVSTSFVRMERPLNSLLSKVTGIDHSVLKLAESFNPVAIAAAGAIGLAIAVFEDFKHHAEEVDKAMKSLDETAQHYTTVNQTANEKMVEEIHTRAEAAKTAIEHRSLITKVTEALNGQYAAITEYARAQQLANVQEKEAKDIEEARVDALQHMLVTLSLQNPGLKENVRLWAAYQAALLGGDAAVQRLAADAATFNQHQTQTAENVKRAKEELQRENEAAEQLLSTLGEIQHQVDLIAPDATMGIVAPSTSDIEAWLRYDDAVKQANIAVAQSDSAAFKLNQNLPDLSQAIADALQPLEDSKPIIDAALNAQHAWISAIQNISNAFNQLFGNSDFGKFLGFATTVGLNIYSAKHQQMGKP